MTSAAASAPGLATELASGYAHNLLLRGDGTLWAWGYNGAGQLGDGTTTSRSTPVQVLSGVRAVSAGFDHTLAIKTDGTLWTWGGNDYGQLGDGTNTNRLSPAQVLTGVQSIAAGGGYSLAIRTGGTLWAWGENISGQLGDGTFDRRPTPVLVLTGVRSVAAGMPQDQVSGANFSPPPPPSSGSSGRPDRLAHTLAVKTDGTLWSWGYNASGQLGTGPGPTFRATPAQVMSSVAAIAAGTAHSLAIRADGTLWTWGANDSGQLGDGATANRSTPWQVLSGVSVIAAGDRHSLALNPDATLLAWGENGDGQLGDGTLAKRSSPTLVMTGMTHISAGGKGSLGIQTGGVVLAWGDSLFGQLGDGGTTARAAPTFVLGEASAVAAGASHSVALKADGTVLTWGYNGSGQLGDYTVADHPTPVPVLTSARAIAAGENHTLAIQTDGSLWGWGDNSQGQLIGCAKSWTSPAWILADVQGAAAGSMHSLAIKSDGSLWEWGSHAPDCTTDRPPEMRLTGVRAVAAGYKHSLAIKADGTLWAWGANDHGQLGTGDTLARTIPVQVLTGVAAVVAGAYHTLAVKADGTLWAWGWNTYGQLGDGTLTDRSIPRQVMAGVQLAAAGGNNSVAVDVDGTLWSWGSGYAGLLGPGAGGWSQSTKLNNAYVRSVSRISMGGGHVLVLTSAARVLAWGSNRSQQLGVSRLARSSTPVRLVDPLASPAGANQVVEYFNPTIRNGAGMQGVGHYFITAEAAEAASIDVGGSGPGWARTGRTFGAWAKAATAPVGAAGVCRFYARAPNSHFYTADAAECQSLKGQNPTNDPNAGWAFEGIAFYTVLPEASGCATGYFPVYRSYNNRFSPNPAQNDGNHRITPSYNDYQRTIRFFGYAEEGIAFCSPVSGDPGGDLQATYTFPGASVEAGSPITAEFLFGNNGAGNGEGGGIYFSLPAEVSDWSVTCASRNGATCPATGDLTRLREGQTIGSWPAGGTLAFAATGTAPQVPTGGKATLNFAATVANASGSPDANPANDTPPLAQMVVKATAVCNAVPNPTALQLSAAAQAPHVNLIVGNGCGWIAQSSMPWLSMTPASGAGDATLTLNLTANTTTIERSGTVTVNGKSVVVTQSGIGCTFSATPPTLTFSASGQSSPVTLTAPAGCVWTAQSSAGWLTVSPSSGSGSTSLSFRVQASAAAPARSGNITIGNLTIPVAQSGSTQVASSPLPPTDPCTTFHLQREGDQVAARGFTEPQSFGVVADERCTWSAYSNTSWITVTTGTGGSGNGAVRYKVDEYNDIQNRSGSITVGAKPFTINQLGTVATGNDSDGGGDGGGGSGGGGAGSGGGAG